MCLWKSKRNGEINEEEKKEIKEWLNKAIEDEKDWAKSYYRRAQFSLLYSSNNKENEGHSIADFQFVIQTNQQNPPFYQLSSSKINSLLLSSLSTESQLQKEENILIIDENEKEDIHIDAEGIGNVHYIGVVELIKGYHPPKSCADHILSDLPEVLEGVGDLNRIANESIMIAQDRIQRLKEGEIKLSEDEAIAIASYSFDLGFHLIDGKNNLYKILNDVLRKRNGEKMKKLQAYLYYLMTALSKLNAYKGTVYRGIPSSHKQNIEEFYLIGSRIHWSAFTSTTTELQKAKISFAEGIGGIIFRIHCLTGRSIRSYSSFPSEDEILLSPNCRLTVTRELHLEDDGYYYVDFVENRNNLVLF